MGCDETPSDPVLTGCDEISPDPIESRIIDGMTAVEVGSVLGTPTGKMNSGNCEVLFYPEGAVELVDGYVTNAVRFHSYVENLEKTDSYKSAQMLRAEKSRSMCRELRKQGRLGGDSRIVVVDGKIFEFAKNERFISPFDEEGVKEYSANDPLIHRATLDGNMKLVKGLLSLNPGLLHKHNRAMAEPLDTAAYAGNLELVKLLVEHGSDVNSVNIRGCTPLFSAAYFGHNDVVDYLIQQGSTVNHKDKYGFTAMNGPKRYVVGCFSFVISEIHG
jgi:hypothetical protein